MIKTHRNLTLLLLKILTPVRNRALYRLLRKIFFAEFKHILIHPLTQCNYNCVYCYNNGTQGDMVTFKEWIALLSKARALGIEDISILGGEPLLYPYLEELFVCIQRLRFSARYLYTNGANINGYWIEKFKQYRIIPVIKFEGEGELYRTLTAQNECDLERLKRIISDCTQAGIPVLTFTVLHKRNIHLIGKIVQDSLRLGALPVFERYIPVQNGPVSEGMVLPDKEYFEATATIENIFQKFLPMYKTALRIRNRTFCGCYDHIISVTSEGEVLPCPYLSISESLGNVRREGLRIILKRYSHKKQSTYFSNERCNGCAEMDVCQGGCKTYSFIREREYASNCTYRKSYVENIGYMLIKLYEPSHIKNSLCLQTMNENRKDNMSFCLREPEK